MYTHTHIYFKYTYNPQLMYYGNILLYTMRPKRYTHLTTSIKAVKQAPLKAILYNK